MYPPASATAESHATRGDRIAALPANVLIRQLYLDCLSQASYVVGDVVTGRAIAVDPRRDTAELLEAASADGLTIELIVETHFHADFLSGHLELQAATGAEIGVGAAGTTEFASRPLGDGEVIDLGGVQIEVLATPGHTPESISLVVRPSAGADPVAVLTGDTLFIGDVGRPDLLVSVDIPAEVMAKRLHRSLRRLLELPDGTLVLPAHGAGSACGKALSTDTVSSIGTQRRSNYALQPMDESAFVALVTEGQPAPPAYFGHDAALNRRARAIFDGHVGPPRLGLAELDHAAATGATVIDTRAPEAFARGHLAGSINVSLGGRFAEQVGTVVPFGTPIVLTGDDAAADEARVRLGRIGFDVVVGVLADLPAVLADAPDRAGRLSRLTADELTSRREQLGDRLQIIDVRNPDEVDAAPIDGARNIPLARLRDELHTLDRDVPVVLVCAGGARSALASSVLRAEGFSDVSDVLGGAAALGASAGCSRRATP
jgi:glyoxylase-like metal-dependent hydrolase (beta-lactamase superfamily II)/rhodanese-related sulfurtransferase